MTKKRTRSKRKGFPVRLERTRWRLLLASMLYQAATEEIDDAEAFHELYEWVQDKMDGKWSGTKTLRVRANQVDAMKHALRFAASIHRSIGSNWDYLTQDGRKFQRNLEELRKIPAIDLLGDAGR